MNVTPFTANGIELYINEITGESFVSLSGLAQLMEADKEEMGRASFIVEMPKKTGEIMTSDGLRGVVLFSEEQIFELALRYNPRLARRFGIVGVRAYLYSLAEYRVRSTAVGQQPQLSLPPHKLAEEVARSIRDIQTTLAGSPSLAQVLIDRAMSVLPDKTNR